MLSYTSLTFYVEFLLATLASALQSQHSFLVKILDQGCRFVYNGVCGSGIGKRILIRIQRQEKEEIDAKFV
jgi:hypothetical protein